MYLFLSVIIVVHMCIKKTVVNKLTQCMVQLVISVNLFHSCTVSDSVFHAMILLTTLCRCLKFPVASISIYQRLSSIPHVHCSMFRSRAFSVARPTIWNSLLDDLCDPSVDSECFQQDLKTHLFRHYRALVH